MKTKTPRTDAAQFIQHDMTAVVDADFARTLEAELAACKESLHLANGTANLALVHRDAAEAELANIRALADRRNKRDHSADTNHQLVAALDQALDIAQAELVTERARLDWLLFRMGGNVLPVNGCVAWTVDVYHYKNQFPSRAAIDAAMKEGAP